MKRGFKTACGIILAGAVFVTNVSSYMVYAEDEYDKMIESEIISDATIDESSINTTVDSGFHSESEDIDTGRVTETSSVYNNIKEDTSDTFDEGTVSDEPAPYTEYDPEITLESIDSDTGDFVLKISNIASLSEGDSITVPVWSDERQTDIVWYEPKEVDGDYYVYGNISNHKYNFGNYNAHVYIRHEKDVRFECGMSFAVLPDCDSLTVNGSEENKTITVKGIKEYSAIKSVSFAVWSEVNGQDDLRWYTAEKTGNGEYSAVFSTRDHRGVGNYNVHCYADTYSGDKRYISAVNFKVESASAEKISAGEITSDGRFDINVSGVKAPSGINKIKAAVWSKDNMSDLIWYELKNENGLYKTTVSIADHKYHIGNYNIHVYLQNSSNDMEFIGAAGKSVDIKSNGLEITDIDGREKQFNIKLKDAILYSKNVEIRYAVWSDENGQDDLRWYKASESHGVYDTIVSIADHRSTGKYNVHCYAVMPDNKLYFVTADNFNVTAPSVESKDISFDIVKETGNIELDVKNITSISKIEKVYAEVWCEDNKNDLVKYEMAADGDEYRIITNVSKHSYHTGIYHAKVIATDENGISSVIAEEEADASLVGGIISVNQEKSEIYYPISLGEYKFYNTVQSISFAVWSSDGGQDDLTWYDASFIEGEYRANFEVANHMKQGEYNVHAYAKMKDGSSRFITAANFNIEKLPVEKVSVTGLDNSNGTFKADISIIRKKDNVRSVRAAIWSRSDQSDLKWYYALMQADGTYYINADVKNHGYDFGKYFIHIYVEDKNGNMSFAAGTETEIQPVNYVKTEKISDCLMKMTVYGAQYNGIPADGVQFPTWSEGNNQTDIVWYDGKKNSDGSFSVSIYRSDFKVDGQYNTHIYVVNSAGKSPIYGMSYNMYTPTNYDSYSAEVMRNIIYAVETGGQIYGNARYDCFTTAFKNSGSEYAITVGAGAWYGVSAKALLKQIRDTDPSGFARLDNAGIAEDLNNEDWRYYGTDLDSSTIGTITSLPTNTERREEGRKHITIQNGSPKAVAIQNIISSKAGMEVQNRLVDKQMQQYVDEALGLGVTDLKARMFCANIRHLGGYSSMKRVVNNCINDGLPLTMDNIWQTMLKHDSQNSGANQVGSPIYHTRHIKVMNWLNKYLG